MRPKLFVHLPKPALERHPNGDFGLYKRLLPPLKSLGVMVEVVARTSTVELDHYTQDDFHLVHHGFIRKFNLLNAGIAYLKPFWYLDPRGVLCDSSISRAVPDLDRYDPEIAKSFVGNLRNRYIARGASKYAQPPRKERLGQGKIVVFLQGMSEPVLRNMYMTEIEMLDLVTKHRGEREILIKVHPKWPGSVSAAFAGKLASEQSGVNVVDANIHDLLDGAYCSVSICSGACFEGFLHNTPALLFGNSDFRAGALTVSSAEEVPEAIRDIGSMHFRHELFLHWFLRKRAYDIRNPSLQDRFLKRLAKAGYQLAPSDYYVDTDASFDLETTTMRLGSTKESQMHKRARRKFAEENSQQEKEGR